MQISKIKKYNYYLLYSLLFLVLCGTVFSIFIYNNRSFIWYGSAGDGLTEHYNAFVYYGEYLRSILHNVFVEHSFSIPLWDPSVGFGSDIIVTFNCYVLGDPLGLLAVFFTPETSEFGYNLLVIIRLFLSGIAFMYYCRYMKLDNKSIVIGALVYVFCGYGLYASVKHPYFINVMIYFPLILVGIEKVYLKKTPFLFIGMIFISALSNFYFFYMLSILMFVYAAFRYVMIYKKITIREFMPCLGKFILFYVIGLALSSFTFLPSAMSILNSSRVGMENYIPAFYTDKYYWNLLSSVIASGSASYWTVLSYSYIVFVSIAALFTQKKNTAFKLGLILLIVFICVPFFGHMFNGFSYFTNRFIWGLSFLASLITVVMLPRLRSLKKAQMILIALIEFIYIVIYCFNPLGISITVFMPILIMVLGTVGIFLLQKSRYQYLFVLTTVILSIFVNAYFRYSMNYGGYVKQFITSGTAYKAMSSVSSNVIDKLDDDGYYRYDQNGKYDEEPFNTTMISKNYGTAFYFSTINGDITKFLYDDLYYTGNRTEIKYSGLDSRTFLDALFNVKYFVVNDEKKKNLPYGFDNVIAQNQNEVGSYNSDKKNLPQFKSKIIWDAVENSNYVPFGYTYDSYITAEEYEKLSVTEKQEALLQSVVLEDEGNRNLKKENNSYSSRKLNYKITNVQGMKQEGNSFELTEEKGVVELTFDDTKDSELYLILKNVNVEERDPLEMYKGNTIYWNSLSEDTKKSKEKQLKYYQTDGRYYIGVESGDISKSLGVFMPKAESYSGFKNFLVNLGYSDEYRNKVTLTFTQSGKYNLNDIEVVSQPMDNYESYVEQLSENHLENVIFDENTINGDISLDKDKMLCLSIPYSKSWDVYVDGEKKDLLKANQFMSGIMLEKGSHDIQMKYRMPYKTEILVLTLFGITGCFIIAYLNKIKLSEKDKKVKRNKGIISKSL